MKWKIAILVVFAGIWVLWPSFEADAVSTRVIDRVRSKAVLEQSDFQIIDNFVAQGVREILTARDFTSIGEIRKDIVFRKSSELNQGQYSEQFSTSSYRHISEAFSTAAVIKPEEQRLRVMVNLLLLVDDLENVRLVDLGLGMLNGKYETIRYLAVRSVTNRGIRRQLNSSGGDVSKVANRIADELKKVVGGGSPAILGLVAEFAAEVDAAGTDELLLRIADRRIREYAEGTVEYELLDATVLKMLCIKISLGGVDKAAGGRRFGQLYSYVIQRYVNGGESLSVEQKHQLASVLVETEQACIVNLFKIPSHIKSAVEGDDSGELLREHNRLLGEATKPGVLASKLKFDYGQKSDGTRLTAPLLLPREGEDGR